MAVYKDSLWAVVLRLVIFWWLVFTLIAFGEDIKSLLDIFGIGQAMYGRLWYVVVACLGGVVLMGVYVFLFKEKIKIDLAGREEMGMKATLGAVPMPMDCLPRVEPHKRLALCDETVAGWLLSQNVPIDAIVPPWTLERSRFYSEEQARQNRAFRDQLDLKAAADAHTLLLVSKDYRQAHSFSCKLSDRDPVTAQAALFLAVWDTYCAHSHYPASHRVGGHGNVKLHVHCLSVASQCLREIDPNGGAWSFDGIYVKRRGRNPVKFLENPSSTGYKLSPTDPLIPIVGLAHDLGKLLAYEVDKKGVIKKNREPRGNTLTDDDAGVIHDTLGPRVLTRLPEFWKLDPLDRPSLTTPIAHYHHPSKFPVNNMGMIANVRAAALMMLLIKADRTVSAVESGIDPTARNSADLGEEELEALYETFVQIITVPGRINGIGDKVVDAKLRIGQKHEDFFIVKLSALLALMRQELNVSLESGEKKHELTNHLLAILKEKGLLYTTHNGADFSLYSPLYRVSLHDSRNSTHFGDVAPALLLNHPPSTMKEFYALTHLALNPANVIVKNLILSHIPKDKIKDKDHLAELNKKAFPPVEATVDVHDEVTDNPEGEFITSASELAKNLAKEGVKGSPDATAGQESTSAEGGQAQDGSEQAQNNGSGKPKTHQRAAEKVLGKLDPATRAKLQEGIKHRIPATREDQESNPGAAQPDQNDTRSKSSAGFVETDGAIPQMDLESHGIVVQSRPNQTAGSSTHQKRNTKPVGTQATASDEPPLPEQKQSHSEVSAPETEQESAQEGGEDDGLADEVETQTGGVADEAESTQAEQEQNDQATEPVESSERGYPSDLDEDEPLAESTGGLAPGDAPLDDDDLDIDDEPRAPAVSLAHFSDINMDDEIAHSIHRDGKVYVAKRREIAAVASAPVAPTKPPQNSLRSGPAQPPKPPSAPPKRVVAKTRSVIRGAGERL